jgi:Fe-Mn family superoxide dismutase
MSYEAKNYDALLGTAGLSDGLLRTHFALYQGYVKNVNAFLESGGDPRRFGWEFNGMRLHELYFENMRNGGAGSIPEEIASLTDGFKALGMTRGIGWVVLYYDPASSRFFNVWINEHDVGHLAGGVPLLVMDVFEHAYIADYGLKRADYVDAFMKAVDWDVVSNRLNASRH